MTKHFGIERVKSGINGLDNLIDGGFLTGHSILVCGMPGTGKTIFGVQYIYKGITDYNENGLYVAIEDHPNMLTVYARSFGWDLEKAQKEKKLRLLNIPIDQRGFKIIDAIEEEAEKVNAKRIVIDSLSALSINARMFDLPLKDQPDPTGVIDRKRILKIAGFAPFEDISQFTYLLVNRITDIGATTLLLADSVPDRALNSQIVWCKIRFF